MNTRAGRSWVRTKAHCSCSRSATLPSQIRSSARCRASADAVSSSRTRRPGRSPGRGEDRSSWCSAAGRLQLRRKPAAIASAQSVRSVPGATGTAALARRERGSTGGGRLMPHPAGQVKAVALGLPRSSIADVGVQRVPVVGGLLRPVGTGDHAERPGNAGASGGRSLDRRPEVGARAVPVGLGGGSGRTSTA